MFETKPHLLFLLRRLGIEVYPNDGSTLLFFPFATESVVNLEVVDAKKLQKELEDFIEQNQWSMAECMIVLSEEVIFSRAFSIENKENTPENIKQFYDEVLFDPNQLVQGNTTIDGNVVYFGANKKIQTVLKKALEKRQNQVTYIYPTLYFTPNLQLGVFGQAGSLGSDFVTGAWNTAPRLKASNLVEKEEPVYIPLPAQVPKVEVGDRKKLLPAFIFAGIAFVFLAYLIYTNVRQITKKPVPKTSPEVQQSAAPSQRTEVAPITEGDVAAVSTSSSSTATKSATAEKNYKIQVLNASGVPGQAALVKDALSPLGYTDIEIANAGTKPETTIVEYDSTVPTEVRIEILQAVQKNFSEAVSTESAKIDEFDIVITTVK